MFSHRLYITNPLDGGIPHQAPEIRLELTLKKRCRGFYGTLRAERRSQSYSCLSRREAVGRLGKGALPLNKGQLHRYFPDIPAP